MTATLLMPRLVREPELDQLEAQLTRCLTLTGSSATPRFTTLLSVERVRWGIIGVGDVTERKSGPGFQQAERSELVAVMRRRGDLAADYARRHDVPRWYDELRYFLATLDSTCAPGHLAEGVVFHHPDGRRAKIKRQDFPRAA